MIRTLYFRIVASFVLVVLISAVGSFFLSDFLFKRDMGRQLESDLYQSSQFAIRLFMESDYRHRELYVTTFARLQHLQLSVIGENGELVLGDPLLAQAAGPIDTRSLLESHDRLWQPTKPPHEPLVGVPFRSNNKIFAVLVRPDLAKIGPRANNSAVTVLLFVLGAGSLMILLIARYLVKPLMTLTEATSRLAKGDFDVAVKLNRRDEIGSLAESFNHMAGSMKQLEQMRQDFVSNVSHEIQTPLTSIRGFSMALRDKLISEEEHERYLTVIQSESERLSRLADNLLQLASLESKHHPFAPSAFDLDEQLRRTVLLHTPLLQEKDLVYHLSLPKTRIVADEDQLYQVWINLLQNSIKFTPAGGSITIAITVLRSSRQVAVTLTDTGIGFGADEYEHIFQRFYKTDRSRTAEAPGNGLGLAIVKKIVDIHSGSIELASEPGAGASFTVKLPITPENPAALHASALSS